MDLRFLSELTATPGPYATAYLDASHDTADAAHADALRWADRRAELADQGADAATLAALDAAVADADPAVGRAGRVLVAAGGRVLLDRTTRDAPARPTATWGPAPDLLPLLLDTPEALPVVAVRVDHAGGEIRVGGRVEEVTGTTENLHEVRADWAVAHRVEQNWRDNAAALAARVDTEVTRVGARVLVLAGEASSRARLRGELSERAASVAVDAEGPDLDAAVAAAVRDAVDAARLAVLDRLDQERARPGGLAAVGLEPVLGALRAEQVDTLLLDGGVTRGTELWVADAPSQVASDADQLRALGSEPTGRVPADAALLRAAAASGASFEPLGGGRTGLVGKPVDDGVAALLRYPLVGS